jgi:hypothetical protein
MWPDALGRAVKQFLGLARRTRDSLRMLAKSAFRSLAQGVPPREFARQLGYLPNPQVLLIANEAHLAINGPTLL